MIRAIWMAGLAVLCAAAVRATDASQATAEHWKLSGNLSEACSCRVPCGCNFGAGRG
jgi:hypothetical protein